MRILITGICGFVGSTLAMGLKERGYEVVGIDNYSRSGSYFNKAKLEEQGIKIVYGDLRNESDLCCFPKAAWVIDAAANPSVLAGVDGKTSSKQLVEHNLFGTVNLLEYCKKEQAGFILLSTSRVYGIKDLSTLRMKVTDDCYHPAPDQHFAPGLSAYGISEEYTTAAPISIYGATKVCSEALALEYSQAFSFPVWINRCGVMAGAGQFGRPDQGIFSYWLHSYRYRKPLRYIGFEGSGFQSRDAFHPLDLIDVLERQFKENRRLSPISNFGGGVDNLMSLKQLSHWCADRWGEHEIAVDQQERPYDIPWVVMDSRQAEHLWGFKIEKKLVTILEEIAQHADQQPGWLELSR